MPPRPLGRGGAMLVSCTRGGLSPGRVPPGIPSDIKEKLTMRKTAAWLLLLTVAISPVAVAGPDSDLEGVYVEARSAQVFIGGCIWNSEAMTIGPKACSA